MTPSPTPNIGNIISDSLIDSMIEGFFMLLDVCKEYWYLVAILFIIAILSRKLNH